MNYSSEDNINLVPAEHCRSALDLDFYCVKIGRLAIEKTNQRLYQKLPKKTELECYDLPHNPFIYLGSKRTENPLILEIEKRFSSFFSASLGDERESMKMAEELVSFNDFIVEIIKFEGENINTLDNTRSRLNIDISAIVLYLQNLGEAVKDLYSLVSVQKTQINNPNYQRLKQSFPIISIMDNFISENPDAIFDLNFPCSYGYIKNFVNYYELIVDEQNLSETALKAVEKKRQVLVDSLNVDAIRQCFGSETNIENIRQIFSNTPVVVVDPLSALVLNKGSINQPSWFNPSTRLIYLNYLDFMDQDNSNSASLIDEQKLTKELLSGLLYASSNNTYILKKWYFIEDGTEYDSYVESRDVWPDYLVESITNQVSENIMSLIGDENCDYVADSNCYSSSLVDAMLEPGNWQKVSLTKSQAKDMLLRAFFDRDNTFDQQGYSRRKEFMAKLHHVTYPGYLQDITELIDLFGIKYVDSLLNTKNLNNINTIGKAKRLRPRHLD